MRTLEQVSVASSSQPLTISGWSFLWWSNVLLISIFLWNSRPSQHGIWRRISVLMFFGEGWLAECLWRRCGSFRLFDHRRKMQRSSLCLGHNHLFFFWFHRARCFFRREARVCMFRLFWRLLFNQPKAQQKSSVWSYARGLSIFSQHIDRKSSLWDCVVARTCCFLSSWASSANCVSTRSDHLKSHELSERLIAHAPPTVLLSKLNCLSRLVEELDQVSFYRFFITVLVLPENLSTVDISAI